jgi:hypothetical protein
MDDGDFAEPGSTAHSHATGAPTTRSSAGGRDAAAGRHWDAAHAARLAEIAARAQGAGPDSVSGSGANGAAGANRGGTAGSRLVTPEGVPQGQRPDMRSLPAFGINVVKGKDLSDDPAVKNREYWVFAATVWNAGPSPLVVEGYRKPGAGAMKAYQFFQDVDGRELGYTSVGTLEYDHQDGHEHWHFTDFAQYDLMDKSKKRAVRSAKEAFCLAPTDPVDLLLPGATARPGSTGLYSACGGKEALAIRETLESGWGDTYGQWLPGQSFDITKLKNGTYYVKVAANPDRNLLETDVSNNDSWRKITLGGKKGARTVKVAPYQGIDYN